MGHMRLFIIVVALSFGSLASGDHAVRRMDQLASKAGPSIRRKKRQIPSAVLDKRISPKRKSSADIVHHGGSASSPSSKPPSMYWAVLHNWLYFLSLGFNLINIQFLVREIVDGDAAGVSPSAKSIALSGKVESVDKLLTFAGIGFLSALSDKYGRKPLMAWSALGFGITNLIQARTKSSIAMLYLADFVDGCSSCMLPLCQAYVTDVSHPANMAGNLGIFQGLSGKYIKS
jgi:hypothetical protein